MSALDIIGAPFGDGANESGCHLAPNALRKAGLLEALRDLGHDVADRGDVTAQIPARPLSKLEIAGSLSQEISALFQESIQRGSVPVLLGGDHSLSAGSIDGALRACSHRPVIILWIDAHADCNTPRTSPTGNPHGMPLAAVMGDLGFKEWFPDATRPLLNSRNTYLLGLRSCDPGEQALLETRAVNLFDMIDIEERGVVPILREILDRVRLLDAHLHVSFDLDVLDPTVMAGVGTPVPGGLSVREALAVMRLLAGSGRVNSVDIVELNPSFDPSGRSTALTVDLIAGLFGRRYHTTKNA